MCCERLQILFLSHALQQMNSPERLILTIEVKQVINNGEVIEGYPEDPRGHSCLMLGRGDNERPVHVVCSPKTDYLVSVLDCCISFKTVTLSSSKGRILITCMVSFVRLRINWLTMTFKWSDYVNPEQILFSCNNCIFTRPTALVG
jgi:hypothetical protein